MPDGAELSDRKDLFIEPFRVVLTCVDHRSRTALAEALLRERLGDEPGVQVRAVGGHKTDPQHGLDPGTLAALRERGLNVPDSPVRALSGPDLHTCDLLLTFDREHRVEVFQYAPRMLQRCFTITELAAIVHAAPQLLRLPRAQRVAAAARLRELATTAPDVPETWQQPAAAHHAAAALIDRAVQQLSPLLRHRPLD